jgi:hypothetical protein
MKVTRWREWKGAGRTEEEEAEEKKEEEEEGEEDHDDDDYKPCLRLRSYLSADH